MSKQKQPFNNLDIPGGFISHFLAIIITTIISLLNQILGRNENTLNEARLEIATAEDDNQRLEMAAEAYAYNFDEITNNELTQNQTTEEMPRRARALTLANLHESEEGTAPPYNTPASRESNEVNSTATDDTSNIAAVTDENSTSLTLDYPEQTQEHINSPVPDFLIPNHNLEAEAINTLTAEINPNDSAASLVTDNPDQASNQTQEHINSPVSEFIPHPLNSSEFLPFDSNEASAEIIDLHSSAPKKLTPKKLTPIITKPSGEGTFDLDDFSSSPKLSGEEAEVSEN
jgi:hypothetical protein